MLDTGIDFGHLLDPDAIARRINPENMQKAALEAARETIQRQRAYLRSRDSFALETTLSGKRETRLIQDAKEKGYAITLFYIALNDPRLNIQRVAERVAQGGHDVPTEDILMNAA